MNLRDLPDMSAAYKQVQERKGDGNLANNAVPYDKVTRADIITGALGKDEEGGKKKPKGHDCAKLVKYKKEEFETIPEMHTMLEDGTVTHYDITNGEYIYENVPVEDLEILISEKHEHFDNYDKNAEMLEGMKPYPAEKVARKREAVKKKEDIHVARGEYDQADKQYKRGVALAFKKKMKKEEVEQVDEADSLAAMAARREKRLQAQRKKMGKSAAGHDFGHDYGMTAAQRKAQQDKEFDAFIGRGKKTKKEAFAFSDEEWEELALLGEEIDIMTDEQLIDFMEEIILEVAEDDQDLIEICEALEEVEVISERVDPKETQRRRDQAKDRLATGAAMKKAADKSAAPSRLERLKSAAKSAAKKVGSAAKAGAKMAKKGVKAAGKSAVSAAGKAAGTYQGEKEAARIKAKRASMQKTPAKKKDDDDDGTGGKLDALLAKTRGTSSSSSSDSGSSSSGGGGGSTSSGGSSSKSGETRKAAGSALRSVGRLVKKGLKKAVGKTSRLISKGSDKLARRLGEDYDQIAEMYDSGLFTIEEIENVVELYKGKHGQSEKEYQDSRSDAGKMISGDSKRSGSAYSSRATSSTGPNPAGGKEKPKGQGRMTSGARTDLLYRKAMLKKQEADKKKGGK